MATLTLRSVKGSGITNAEADANFSALNTELAGKAAFSHTQAIATIVGLRAALDARLARLAALEAAGITTGRYIAIGYVADGYFEGVSGTPAGYVAPGYVAPGYFL